MINKNKKDDIYSVRVKLIIMTLGIMVFSNILVVIIYAILIHFNILTPNKVNPIITASSLLLSSVLIGLIVTPFVSNSISNITNKLISALKEVSKGNFDVYLTTKPSQHPKIKEIINNFNAMVKGLNSIETLRSDFISNFSHEFKTPLVSMMGFAKLLKDPNTSDEEKEEYINIIIDESKRLSDLATNVLLLSKLKSENYQTPKKTTFIIDEQIRQSVLLFEKQWSEKNINLNLDLINMKYTGNEELIKQIWINLISNAIKFTNINGNIEILSEKVDNNYVIKFCDDGIGMNENEISHIFEKFYQADTSHSTSGNGLGLAIVSEILNLHKGKISVESSPNKGTTFTVFLPLEEE